MTTEYGRLEIDNLFASLISNYENQTKGNEHVIYQANRSQLCSTLASQVWSSPSSMVSQHLQSMILQKAPWLLMMSLCCTYLDPGLSFEAEDTNASQYVHASGEYKCGLVYFNNQVGRYAVCSFLKGKIVIISPKYVQALSEEACHLWVLNVAFHPVRISSPRPST